MRCRTGEKKKNRVLVLVGWNGGSKWCTTMAGVRHWALSLPYMLSFFILQNRKPLEEKNRRAGMKFDR